MAGSLSVTKIQGLSTSATPTTVEISSGHKLIGAAGAMGVTGSVVQVVQNTDGTSSTTTSTSYVNTPLNVTITPTSASNKIHLSFNFAVGFMAQNEHGYMTLYRGSTNLNPASAGGANDGFFLLGNSGGDARINLYPIGTSAAASSTKTITISGLTGGSFQIAMGGYSNAGQSSWHYHATVGGYMTGTNMYNVTELASWTSGSSVAVTKNASNMTIAVTNNSGSYTLNMKGYAIGGSGANLTISYS